MPKKKAISNDPHLTGKYPPIPSVPHLPEGYNENPLGDAVSFEASESETEIDPLPVDAAKRALVEQHLAQEAVDRRAELTTPKPSPLRNLTSPTATTDPTLASAIAQMQAELAAARREISLLQKKSVDADAGAAGYPRMYYRRPKDGGPMSGWIVCAQGGVGPQTGGRDIGTYAILVGKGFKPLPMYGITGPAGSNKGFGGDYIAFLQSGGAKEVPASQVIQLRWHVKPPLPGTVFPQYEAVKDQVVHFLCDEGGCDTEFWLLPEDQITAGACLDHLRRNHDYKYNEARAVLKDQGIPFRTSRVREAIEAKENKKTRRELREELEDEEGN